MVQPAPDVGRHTPSLKLMARSCPKISTLCLARRGVRQLVSFQAVLSAHQTTRGSNLTIYPVTAISAEKAA
jgi:hypothetical protein